MWKGVIIEQSLSEKTILEKVKIVKIRKTIDKITKKNWTLYDVKVEDYKLKEVVELGKKTIKQSWWMAFKTEEDAVIIFKDKAFRFKRSEIEKQKEIRDYSISVGVPEKQSQFRSFFNR